MRKKDTFTYRAALNYGGEIRFCRGSLHDVITWLDKSTQGLPEDSYKASVTPVSFLLPWERRRDS